MRLKTLSYLDGGLIFPKLPPGRPSLLIHRAHLILLVFAVIAKPCACSDIEQTALTAHNSYRKYHNTPLLAINQEMSKLAQKCAEYYIKKVQIDHTCGFKKDVPTAKYQNYGENIFQSLDDPADGSESVKKAVDDWYGKEEPNYDYKTGDFKKGKSKSDKVKIGHFTQLMWKEAQEIGVGYASDDDGYTKVVVVLYEPRGNQRDAYQENILPPGDAGGKDHSHGSQGSGHGKEHVKETEREHAHEGHKHKKKGKAEKEQEEKTKGHGHHHQTDHYGHNTTAKAMITSRSKVVLSTCLIISSGIARA